MRLSGQAGAGVKLPRPLTPPPRSPRRDEYGRLLTTKEAWRQLNYGFHGFKPSAKRQEKRLKEVKDEQKKRKVMNGERQMVTQAALSRMQRNTGQAYLPLDGSSARASTFASTVRALCSREGQWWAGGVACVVTHFLPPYRSSRSEVLRSRRRTPRAGKCMQCRCSRAGLAPAGWAVKLFGPRWPPLAVG